MVRYRKHRKVSVYRDTCSCVGRSGGCKSLVAWNDRTHHTQDGKLQRLRGGGEKSVCVCVSGGQRLFGQTHTKTLQSFPSKIIAYKPVFPFSQKKEIIN